MERLRDDMEHMFGFLPDTAEFPPVNVTRLADRVVVEAFLPGADRSTLEVSTVGTTLTIRGERKTEPDVGPNAYHRRERETGRFVRTLKLDDRIGTDKVNATYRDGVLRIELPYAPEAVPRQVVIKS
jgi:HSP20 family protein